MDSLGARVAVRARQAVEFVQADQQCVWAVEHLVSKRRRESPASQACSLTPNQNDLS